MITEQMDRKWIPNVFPKLPKLNDQNGAKRSPGIATIRSERSTAAARAAVVGKPKWWVVSGRARLRIVTTLTRWFDFLKNVYPDLWRENSNLTNTFRAPDFLGKMIQFDEHTFQVG